LGPEREVVVTSVYPGPPPELSASRRPCKGHRGSAVPPKEVQVDGTGGLSPWAQLKAGGEQGAPACVRHHPPDQDGLPGGGGLRVRGQGLRPVSRSVE